MTPMLVPALADTTDTPGPKVPPTNTTSEVVTSLALSAHCGRTPGHVRASRSGNRRDGKIKETWFIVPGSATGDFSKLRGEGGFEGDLENWSDGTLDYWFE